MRFLLLDHIDSAFYSLKMNRSRTALTILGLTVGIASITAILVLAGGVTSIVDRQIESIGGNVAVIRPSSQASLSTSIADAVSSSFYRTSTLTDGDLKAIQTGYPSLDVAPIMSMTASLTSDVHKVKNAPILATTPDVTATSHLPIDIGQFIDSTTNDSTAVVGADLAVDLFGTNNPLGRSFQLHGQDFTVIGVLKKIDNPFNYDGIDYDNTMIIDFNAGKALHGGYAQIQQITIKAASAKQLQQDKAGIDALLLKHHGERDFSIIVGHDIAVATNGMFIALASIMGAIAAISLVVGGIGVMNVMLVSVAERTREIGIRKAVGASGATIVIQFLVEAILMSIAGGILGYASGIVVAFVATTQLYFTPVVTWQSAVIALSVAIGTGIIFGLYPALRAARRNPIESLRQYR